MTLLRAGLLFLLLAPRVLIAAEPELNTLRATYEERLAAITAQRGREEEALRQAILRELANLEDALAARGDLDGLVQCRRARALATEGWLDWPDDLRAPAVAAVAHRLALTLERLRETERARQETLRRQYLLQLEALQVRLTQAKRVEAALAVQAEASRLRGVPGPAKPPPDILPERPVPPAGHRVLHSFEDDAELATWEVRSGPPPLRVERHFTHGRHALELRSGHLLVSQRMPADWRGHHALAFDVFLEGAQALPLEITLGDQAWLDQQNYWNRHNRVEMLRPGAQTVRIPLAELYRGEAAKQNAQIPRNLDLEAMRYLALQCGGREARLVLDHLRLEKELAR
jgi:hypothetical protein